VSVRSDTPLAYRATALVRRALRDAGTRMAYASPLAAPLRRGLRAVAPDGPQLVTVCGGANRDARMYVDLAAEKFYWLGTHEDRIQRHLQSVITKDDVVYDIGAHVGFFTLLCARLARHVVALEPLPENAGRLRENIAANALTNVTVRAAAAGARDGAALMTEGATSLEGRVASHDFASGRYVPGVTIDALVREGCPPPSLMKIDVEGWEAAVIRGGRATIAAERPRLVVEVHSRGAGDAVLAALPVPYRFTNLDGGRDAERLQPGHYAGVSVEAA